MSDAVTVIPARSELAPLVLDSPHTGMLFPDDFRPALPMADCMRVNDWFVDELFGAGPDHGAPLILAEFRRAYIDPNRDTTDLDLEIVADGWPHPVKQTEKTSRGASLIWRMIDGDKVIYDRKLSHAEVTSRIEQYWRPYHAAVKTALDDAYAAFGKVFHINCHSMPEFGNAVWGDPNIRRADMVIGTRDGSTAGDAFTAVVVDQLRAAGYQVAINEGFKGVELVRRYSHPAAGRESLQIEVNRGIYMDEAAITRSDRFAQTQADITAMIAAVADYARTQVSAG